MRRRDRPFLTFCRTFTYGTANRLTSVLDNGVISQYAYNGDGDRLSQTVGGVTTGYVFDPVGLTQVLAETTGGVSTHYIPGLAQYSGGGWQYFGQDRLGSVRTLLNPTGELLLARNYDPFGNLLAQGGAGSSGFGYTGEQVDSTELVYLRARYYQPSVGRFLTPDTIVPDPLRSQSWNRYAYVENNPVRYSDPSGHCFFAGIDTVACIAVAKITIEALALGGALYLVNSEPFQQATFNAGRGLRDILETIPPISPGEFNPVAPFPGNVCSEPGLLPGAPPIELPFEFPGPLIDEPFSGLHIFDPPKLIDPDLVPNVFQARRNVHLAGKRHPVTGIPFDQDGYPDFSSVSVVDVKIGFTGSRGKDVKAANDAAGFDTTPRGYVWHHHQDGTTMQLVPANIHRKTGHDGGFAGN